MVFSIFYFREKRGPLGIDLVRGWDRGSDRDLVRIEVQLFSQIKIHYTLTSYFNI